MNLRISRIVLLLAVAAPVALVSNHAGAVVSPDSGFREEKTTLEFSKNLPEKLNLFIPDNLLAKRNFRRVIQPDFRDVFRENQPPAQTIPQGTIQSNIEQPSAVAVMNSLLKA
jgi:hypothetical protein